MTIINKLKTRYQLLKLRNYIRRKLAYHEAGHLVFSYLMQVSCKYISVDFYFEDKIRFENEYAIVTMNSKSEVYHLLSKELELNLNRVKDGINSISKQNGEDIEEAKKSFNKYFTILLSGYYSQQKFSNSFFNQEMEFLQENYSQDITQRNLNEDITRFNYLNTNLFTNLDDRKKTFTTVQNLINFYLEQTEVQNAINVIANQVKNNKKIEQNKIEYILNKIHFLNYCSEQNQNVLSMI